MSAPTDHVGTGRLARRLGVSPETIRDRVREGLYVPDVTVDGAAGYLPATVDRLVALANT